MKILIIGSQGFIGSHLDDYFSKKENVIYRCDAQPINNGSHYFQVNKFNPDYHDVIRSTEPDVCIYAGGNGNVSLSIQDSSMDYTLNTTDVWKILNALKEVKPTCKFIHISSAAVYGNPTTLPIKENDVIRPLSPYGWHKYMAEIICNEFHTLFQIPTINLRVFSVYGERLRKQLFWDIYQKYIHSSEIVLFGTGKETRDFIYISDLVRVFDCIIEKSSFNGQSINVSSGIETTIEEAAAIFGRHYDSSKKIIFNHQTKLGDPLNWRSDVSTLTSLGFSAKVTMENGLKNYIKWLKENA